MARYSKVVKKKKKKKNRFLPETAHVFLARRIIDGTALIMFVLGVSALLSIASYHHTDPSANTASAAESSDIGNWLGVPGAYLSDFLLQTVGLAGLVFGLVFAVWGVRIYKRQSLSPLWLRALALMGAAFTASIAAARIASGGWLLAPYMGGSIGIVTLQSLVRFMPDIGFVSPYTLLACIAGVLSLGMTFFALAIRREEYEASVNFVKYCAVTAFDFSVYTVTSFIEWVRHYGDPDYELPARPRREKVKKEKPAKEPKIRKEPKITTDEPPFDTGDVPAAMAAPARAEPPVSGNINVIKPKAAPTPKKSHQSSFALDDSSEWQLPTIDLLEEPPKEDEGEQLDENALRQNAELLKNVLADFNIEGEITSIHPGPVVTLYELEPAPGTKTSRVIGLSDDIARSMSAISVRCSVIPGRSVIGIEIPNARRQTVHFYDMLEQTDIASTKQKLPLILGKDIGGSSVIADLAKMPHLLVAGTTGSGKSVAVNTMILSLIYHHSPEKCRLIMIDPKMLELSVYDGIPHLLTPVVTEPGKAVVALKWAVQEMEERYRAMSKLGVRNIDGYNQRLREAREKGETIMRKVQTGFDPETGKPVYEEQPLDLTELPYIVIFVDEFADLMLVAGKDVENAIQRLAQMARAAGLHLIMATQRPSVDVITGIIKANFPTRISFQVTSKVDSRTILNEGGAEQLLGMGDMLYMPSGGQLTRVHGPFVTDNDVESVVSFLKKQGEPAYIDDVTEGGDFGDSDVMNAMFGGSGGNSDVDELYDKAVAIVARERKASTSFIQRHLQIGYNRAARIMEEMEKQGVVSPATSTGKREVLVSDFSDA